MLKIVAIKCHLLRLKCTKFDFGWGSAPDLLAGFEGELYYYAEGGKVMYREGRDERGETR